MPKGTDFQGNFTSGEITPLLEGRPDINRFNQGVLEARNFAVRPQGGLFRRQGTEFVGTLADSVNGGRLIKFEFSDTQAYILEFTNTQMRIWKDGLLVVGSAVGTAITGITQASPCVVTTSAAHGLSVGERIRLQNISGMTELNDRELEVGAVTATTITLVHPNQEVINSTNYTAYTSGGTVHEEITLTTPWSNTELDQIQWAQSANELYICHPDYAPRIITRTSDTAWTITTLDNKDGPYGDPNEDESISLELKIKAGGRVVAFSATNADPAVITIDTNTSSTYYRNHPVATDIFEAGDRVYIDGAAGGTWSTLNQKFYRIQNPATPSGSPNQGTIELVDEDTGTQVDSTGLGTLTAATMMICHADTVADAVDTSGNTFFSSGEVHTVFEYRDKNIWTLALQMDSPSSASNTSKVQLLSWMTKLDIAQTAEIGPFRADNGVTGIVTNFSDVFDQEDVGLLIRNTDNAHWTGSAHNAVTAASGGQGAWANIEYVTSGDTVAVRRQQHTAWESAPASGLQRYHARSYESGFGSGENFIAVKNKQLKGIVEASQATFASTDVDRWLRLEFGETIVNCQIETFISTTQVRVSLDVLPKVVLPSRSNATDKQNISSHIYRVPIEDNGITTNWTLGAWHGGTTDGVGNFPRVVSFHEQRLVLASTSDKPDTLWFSKIRDFNKFTLQDSDGVVTDEDAIEVTVGSTEVNPIIWLASGKTLFIGTLDREYAVTKSDNRQALSPTNIVIQSQSAIGAEQYVRPVITNQAAFFLQRGGRNLREMTFDFNQDGYVARNMNAIAEHIISGSFAGATVINGERMAFKPGTPAVFLVVVSSGIVAAMTYEPEQQVAGWWTIEIGGTNDLIEDAVVLPNNTGKEFDIYFIVRRSLTTPGVQRYIEKLELRPLAQDETYLDNHIRGASKNSSASVVVGLEYMNGETVRFVEDGVDAGTASISGGQISYNGTASDVDVGYSYTSQIETLPIEAGAGEGFAQGKTRRLDNLQALVINSVNLEHSGDESNWTTDDFNTNPTGTTYTVISPFSGYRNIPAASSHRHGRSPTIFIRQTAPYPLNILAIAGRVKTTK